MKKLLIIINLFIMATALSSGICSYRTAKNMIEKDGVSGKILGMKMDFARE